MTSWLPVPYKVVILGGGLSGLSAAHAVVKYSKIPCHVTILERQQRIGGWLESTRFEDGTVFEHGPRSARSYGNVALESLNIISELNVDDKVIGIPKSHEAARRRYIYAKGKINELPSSISSVLFRQDPFTKSLLSSICREPFVKKGTQDDESVYDFFQRRFNVEIAAYLSDPLCRGIFGGDAKKLSLRSCFQMLFDYERQHGSIIKGALFTKKGKPLYKAPLIEQAKSQNWMAWTLDGGIQTLPELWCEHLKTRDVKFMLGTTCKQIEVTSPNEIKCKTTSGTVLANHVISTLPGFSLASLIKQSDLKLSSLLDLIEYADMAVVNLEYKSAKVSYNGFGFLVPSSEPCDVLGMTFDSQIFPHHTKKNSTILTAMAGGAWFKELFGDPNNADVDKITEIAIKSSNDILGIKESPARTLCKIQQKCIPQYACGHERRAEMIRSHVKSNNLPLTILGNIWGGVGVNDVIVNARNNTLKWLAGNAMY